MQGATGKIDINICFKHRHYNASRINNARCNCCKMFCVENMVNISGNIFVSFIFDSTINFRELYQIENLNLLNTP